MLNFLSALYVSVHCIIFLNDIMYKIYIFKIGCEAEKIDTF